MATPRNPLAAWRTLEAFIDAYAIANEWSATGLSVDASPDFVPAGTYKGRPSDWYSWFEKPAERKPIGSQTLMAVLDVASRLPKSKIQWRYPIQLHFGFNFFWRGRPELQTPNHVDRNHRGAPDWGPGNPYSRLDILVRDHLFVQPFFLFPYEWGTDLGGPEARLSIGESVPNLVNVLLEKQGIAGLEYLDYLGRTVPW